MQSPQSPNRISLSEDLVGLDISTGEVSSLSCTTIQPPYEKKINALTLENEKMAEENDALTNDLVALSHECWEIERECLLERSANVQLTSTINALSHECEDLVQENHKYLLSSMAETERLEVQRMKQMLKKAAEERVILQEKVSALERESYEMDTYIRFLESKKTEKQPLVGNTTSERRSRSIGTDEIVQHLRRSKSLRDPPESFPAKNPSNSRPTRSSWPILPLLTKSRSLSKNGGLFTKKYGQSRRASKEDAMNFCKSAMTTRRNSSSSDDESTDSEPQPSQQQRYSKVPIRPVAA